jgi:hypothetical protein
MLNEQAFELGNTLAIGRLLSDTMYSIVTDLREMRNFL